MHQELNEQSRSLLPNPVPVSDASFFVICTPGLEDVTAREIKCMCPKIKVGKAERGGVLVSGPLGEGLIMNRYLKTPSRILLRLGIFGCRDFPKLFKKISGLVWEDWISDRADVQFHASSHGSRLKMKKRIEETCREARIHRLRKRGRPHARFEGGIIDVFVRLDDDVCTLSLDTSGELLHKRNQRTAIGDAPLRETLAASLIELLIEKSPSGQVELVDPMMGSGTFFVEAEGLFNPIQTRAFAYESFAASKLELAKSALEQVPAPNRHIFFSRFVGFDLDQHSVEAAKANLVRVGLKTSASFQVRDFFTAEPLQSGVRRWVICNPPYDERLIVQENLKKFYEDLFIKVDQVTGAEIACFLLPEKVQPERLLIPKAWRPIEARRFLNGGLPVVAMFYQIPTTSLNQS